jgi:hypothetical protein
MARFWRRAQKRSQQGTLIFAWAGVEFAFAEGGLAPSDLERQRQYRSSKQVLLVLEYRNHYPRWGSLLTWWSGRNLHWRWWFNIVSHRMTWRSQNVCAVLWLSEHNIATVSTFWYSAHCTMRCNGPRGRQARLQSVMEEIGNVLVSRNQFEKVDDGRY